jgi:hypothetical protein
MLGLDMLDVGIGVVFVFLLVSLIASAIAEYIENFLKKRASDLEKGIREMLRNDESLTQQLYDHPLIASLYEGKTHKEAKEAGKLPSYIPARSFALAMMDLLLSTDDKSGSAGSTPQSAVVQTAVAQTADGANAEVVENAAKIETVSAEVMTELRKVAALHNPAARTVQERLSSIPADVAKTLVMFVDAAGGDAAKVRTNIEGWFNASMDRVSGWYKRRNHQILVGIGLVLAILFNIDTISIVQSLWTNKGMRDAGVAAAGAFAAKDPAASTAAPEQKIRDYSKSLNTLKLPIGWEAEVETWPKGTNIWCAAVAAVPPHLIGWIITAAAVSMGAPFWFDTLNKIMVVRSTIKPHEKSAEEAPKERTSSVT